MSSNERRLQTQGVNWLEMSLPDIMVIAVPNEQSISLPPLPDDIYKLLARHGMIDRLKDVFAKQRMIAIQNLKRLGMYPGAADIFLCWNDGLLQVRALETKDKAPQSANQEKFQKHWESIGGHYRIWRSLTELHDICVEWGLNPCMTPPDYTPTSKKHLLQGMLHNFYTETKKDA